MSCLSELSSSVLPEHEPVIHTPLVRKKRSLPEESLAEINSCSSSSSSIPDLCNESKIPTGKKLKHKLPLPHPATKEVVLDNESAAVMQDMEEAGKSYRIRRQLWFPVQQLMQKIALDTYFKVDKFYREKEGREPLQRTTQDIFHELKAAGQLSLISRADLQQMERLIEKIGYEAFVEIERFYCELEEYDSENAEIDEETDI
jgi:hypothetical protein